MSFQFKKALAITANALIFSFVLFSFSSCFQYPEGPVFTLQTRDERLSGNWFIDQVTDANGNDITASYQYWTLNVVASKEGLGTFSYFNNGTLYSYGTYDFADFGDQLIIAFTEYQNENVSADAVQKFLDVLRLTDQHFYYTDDQGIEFHWEKY